MKLNSNSTLCENVILSYYSLDNDFNWNDNEYSCFISFSSGTVRENDSPTIFTICCTKTIFLNKAVGAKVKF